MTGEGDFSIVSLNSSDRKGTVKTPVGFLDLVAGLGAAGDAHAGPGKRQLSLLGAEDIEAFRARGIEVGPGEFAENITTRGIDLPSLPLGTRIEIGNAILEISQIGKECHAGCAIRRLTGDCVMPRRGVFAYVVAGGRIGRADTGHYSL